MKHWQKRKRNTGLIEKATQTDQERQREKGNQETFGRIERKHCQKERGNIARNEPRNPVRIEKETFQNERGNTDRMGR
jgi:hypothetical protein